MKTTNNYRGSIKGSIKGRLGLCLSNRIWYMSDGDFGYYAKRRLGDRLWASTRGRLLLRIPGIAALKLGATP